MESLPLQNNVLYTVQSNLTQLVYKIFSYLEHRGAQRVLNVSYYYSKEWPLICFQLFTILVRIVVISKREEIFDNFIRRHSLDTS